MTEPIFDHENPTTRRLINQHKSSRMIGLAWSMKRHYFLNNPEECFRAYIEQCGDLEIYRELYEEAKSIDADN